MTNYYTGVGSRDTPISVQDQMTCLAHDLYVRGWILRSGAADGADSAFARGAGPGWEHREIYLPWRNFNGSKSMHWQIPDSAFEMAMELHGGRDKWAVLPVAHKALKARNMQQVLGKYLDTPSRALVCWTRNGKLRGGTAITIKCAQAHNIPVYNLADMSADQVLWRMRDFE